jgi:anthraniloyl-CoA monooxygenase
MRTICVGAGPAGLYFGILTKLRDPDAHVTVLERNPEGLTYGWGVTFFEDVLDSLYAGDPVSAAEIQRSAASWGEQAVWLGNQPAAHLRGYGWAIGRHHLLKLLAERATGLGVEIHYDHLVDAESVRDQFADADLVLAADGVNSQLRQQFTDEFGTTIDFARNRYMWLGTTKVFTAFTYAFERTEAGWIWFYAYPFDTSTTTFIAECGPSTWEGLGFDRVAPEEGRAELERIFVRHLDGHPLLLHTEEQGSSPWLNFTWVTNRSWYHGNVVLAGDAAHTTHFSIGAGTWLAIDDVLALNRQLQAHGGTRQNVPGALRDYQRERVASVGVAQRVARYSAAWLEQVESYTALDPTRFSFALGTRFIGSPAPAGMPWLKHQATQLSVGRRAHGIANAARRRQRARQRLSHGWRAAPR